MGSHTRGNTPGEDDPKPDASGTSRPVAIESRRHDLAAILLELHRLLELGPGESGAALHPVELLGVRLKKVLPKTRFRHERLCDLQTDFALWFSKGPRVQFDCNDEALRSMLLVDIHRFQGSA